jgi:hypothetical protein
MSANFLQRGRGESGEAGRKTIPFEYAFQYSLNGNPGTTTSRTVTVSIESTFVAVSIGYGVTPPATTLTFGASPPPPSAGSPISVAAGVGSLLTTTFGDVIESIRTALGEKEGAIGPATAAVLTNGFRLNPQLAERLLLSGGATELDPQVLAKMFVSVGAPAGEVQFLYALRDEASGREFQSQPILNTAGLGVSDGDRPFRYFARPISFAPRSMIRMDITEISNFKGDLHVALHGYKVLGAIGTPTDTASAMRTRTRRVRRRRIP